MHRRTFSFRKTAVALALLGAVSLACCPAWRSGAEGVHIADQEILIYYDADKGIEHFVRRADFFSSEPDFGFLVPTPTQPRLTETPDQVFRRLAQAIKPKVQYQTRYRPSFMPFVLMPFMALKADSAIDEAAGSIEVLDTAFVGGFEAAVLRADDAEALVGWLEENGYDARPDLKEWVQPYIDKKWIVTAFKFDPEAESNSVSTAAVCMSFETDAPFFPYRVPKDQLAEPGRGSMLRVYYVGGEKVGGAFENGDADWPAKTKFSNAIAEPATLLEGVGVGEGEAPAADYPAEVWLTAFEDNTWPGGTEDLYFTAAADPDPVIPPPIIRTSTTRVPVPPDLVIGLAAIVFVLVRLRRRVRDGETLDN